jgi:hypothetical protein
VHLSGVGAVPLVHQHEDVRFVGERLALLQRALELVDERRDDARAPGGELAQDARSPDRDP